MKVSDLLYLEHDARAMTDTDDKNGIETKNLGQKFANHSSATRKLCSKNDARFYRIIGRMTRHISVQIWTKKRARSNRILVATGKDRKEADSGKTRRQLNEKLKSGGDDEPPGSVRSEIADSTYNLSPISLTRPFTKPNVASPAQVELY